MSSQQAGRLSVGVIGAGPVGTVLGQALAAAGHQLVAANTKDPQAALAEADLVLFAIPAERLPELLPVMQRRVYLSPVNLLLIPPANLALMFCSRRLSKV